MAKRFLENVEAVAITIGQQIIPSDSGPVRLSRNW